MFAQTHCHYKPTIHKGWNSFHKFSRDYGEVVDADAIKTIAGFYCCLFSLSVQVLHIYVQLSDIVLFIIVFWNTC